MKLHLILCIFLIIQVVHAEEEVKQETYKDHSLIENKRINLELNATTKELNKLPIIKKILKTKNYTSGEIKIKVKVKASEKTKENTLPEERKNESKKNILISTEKKKNVENIINPSEKPLNNKVIYESTSVKAEKIAKYGFMGILSLITIITLISNKNKGEKIKETLEKWYSQ